MCEENINQIIALDFAQTDDSLNWINTSSNQIVTVDGKLVIQPDGALSQFSRGLGQIANTNNRIRYKLNVEIFSPAVGGSPTVNYLVQIFNGVNLIGQSTIYIEGIEGGQIVRYSLDRTYTYEELAGNVSIRIKATQGWQNELRLEKLDVMDFNFCEDKVRTYFVFDQLFETSQTAQSAGLRIRSWKIGGVETVTAALDTQNQSSVGGNPVAGWKYAKADIDGSDRVAAAIEENTFNPFADEFGLVFDTVNSFWGGKPTGTAGNQDFGAGVMTLGFEKPVILNGILEPKAGAFFIDIDYSQDLYVEIDVLVNQTSGSVYNNPTTFRRFVIIWDVIKCSKDFYFLNQLQQPIPQKVDQMINGFLTGLTGITVEDTVLPCGQALNFTGNVGSFTFTLDLGTAVGMVLLNYNAIGVPDKFDVAWSGINITSNYRGSSTYNQQLLNAGVPANQIETANPSNGAGQLAFFKNTPAPTTCLVTVTAPLGGTAWTFAGVCPAASMEVWLYRAICGADISGTPDAVRFMPSEDPLSYIPQDGDIVFNQAGMFTPYAGAGAIFRMRIPLGYGPVAEVAYQFTIANNGTISNVQPC